MSTKNATVLNWPSNSTEISFDNLFETRISKDIKFDLDLLVLSATLYRLRNSTYGDEQIANQYRCLSLIEDNIQQYVTESDYEFAEEVRQHFSQKLMMLKLKTENLTSFREDLNQFLHASWHNNSSRSFVYPKKFVGLAYKLPYFYIYDNQLNSIFGSSYSKIKGPQQVKGEKKLSFLTKIHSHTRRGSGNIEYWFEDEYSNKVMISLENHNPLLNLFNKLITDTVVINGKFDVRHKDTMEYYNSYNWTCVA